MSRKLHFAVYKILVFPNLTGVEANGLRVFNPSTPNIKEQILLSCQNTYFYRSIGEKKVSRKFTLGDHNLNSHDLSSNTSSDQLIKEPSCFLRFCGNDQLLVFQRYYLLHCNVTQQFI